MFFSNRSCILFITARTVSGKPPLRYTPWMTTLIIALAALSAIIWELLNPGRSSGAGLRVLRAAPFICVALLSLYTAGKAPQGRHPIRVDLSLAREDLARSM